MARSHRGTAAQDGLAEQLPEPLRPLARLAYNLRWSWQPGGAALWRAVDAAAWESSGHNPPRLLRETIRRTLEAAAADPALVARVRAAAAALDAELAQPPCEAPPATGDAPIAFLCAEYAIHPSLPIYSGGLGVLAGDLLKEASDRRLPMVAVGLLYRRGYLHQRLDPSGMQHEFWSETVPELLPVERAADAAGAPLTIEVPLRTATVRASVWRVDVGRVPLFLLDTDRADNDPVARFVTAQLYVGDPALRLMQYALLGLGAPRALAAAGIEPAVYHFNEGHPALAALELAGRELSRGATFAEALERVRRRTVFTTHTPVAAGNERYALEAVAEMLDRFLEPLRPHAEALLALGRAPGAPAGEPFGMTDLALATSRTANAVSRRHGEVARAMWAHHWPGRAAAEVPIRHVTNGVHLPTWMSAPMRELLDRHLGPAWVEHAADPARWAAVEDIPDAELWEVRQRLRTELIGLVRERSVRDRLARGEPLDYVERAAQAFDPDVLTVGFARRVASYKRLHLLVADPARALGLLTGPRALQVIIAGKAHPRDEGAKKMVQAIFALKRAAGARVVFLEDYDMELARTLVAGCDVWVNLPRPPMEASGTSGMKAALNGVLNLSVLDGWWCEGYEPGCGWAIRSDPELDPAEQDRRDADALYGLLERGVVPLFHDRGGGGLPRAWLRRIRTALHRLGPAFNTARTLEDYVQTVYRPDATQANRPEGVEERPG